MLFELLLRLLNAERVYPGFHGFQFAGLVSWEVGEHGGKEPSLENVDGAEIGTVVVAVAIDVTGLWIGYLGDR